jgi:hypothetical protein
VAFLQFGFQLRTGIAFKSYTFMNTSDWLGPYNIIMAPTPPSNKSEEDQEAVDPDPSPKMKEQSLQKFVSRYVTTPASTNQLHYPSDATIIQQETFDRMVGLMAINETIHLQRSLQPGQDPFGSYHSTCVKGDIPAGILPQIQLGLLTTTTTDGGEDADNGGSNGQTTNTKTLTRTTTKTEISMFRVDFSMLSLPEPKSKLYNLWPTLKKHLGSEFPIEGPYCYGNDPKRAYAIKLSYDSKFEKFNNETWHVLKGCYPDLPCWNDDHEVPTIPYDNGDSSHGGMYILDPTGVAALICYVLGFLLVVSLVFNCQLSNQLKRLQREYVDVREDTDIEVVVEQERFGQGQEPIAIPQQEVFNAFNDLEEPLLGGNDSSGNVSVEESKE